MKSIYEERPWLKSYPSEIPSDIEIPLKTLGQAFDEMTEKWKDKTAIIFYGKKMSFRELKEKVDRFANALSQLGIKKGDRVAMLMLNSPEHIIAFFSILKLGAIQTPLSPVYVSQELKYQLEDSGATTIICHDILYESLEKTGFKFTNVILANINESLPTLKRLFGKSILREVYQQVSTPKSLIINKEDFYQFKGLIEEYPPNPPDVEINPKKDIAVLPYTGGTTGRSKGVALTHYNLLAHEIQFRAMYPFLKEGEEVFISYMPFYHAGGQVCGMLRGVLGGATQVVITTPDLDTILTDITRYKATAIIGAPAIYELLKDYEKTDRVNWKQFKITFCGADILYEKTARGWKDRTGIDLHEMYGMTELAAVSHANPLGKSKIGSIGIPVPNMVSAILDPDKDEFLSIGEM